MATPFPVLMQQAGALRTARQVAFRKKFDARPIWEQHSYYCQVRLALNASPHPSLDLSRRVQP